MTNRYFLLPALLLVFIVGEVTSQRNVPPDEINFVRQGVRRFIFDAHQKIPLSALVPREVIGMSGMYPASHYLGEQAAIAVIGNQLSIQSESETETAIWFGGFNPFATYTIDLAACQGRGEIGFEFSDARKAQQLFITVTYSGNQILDVRQTFIKGGRVVVRESIATSGIREISLEGNLILQMLGSGLTMYTGSNGLPTPIGQSAFNKHIDLREKRYINSFQSSFYLRIEKGSVVVNRVESNLSSGMGLADIRAMTYENGEPLLDQGRLWYTMTMRGRALPHHLQGVFSMDPSVFDIRLEGVIVFDQNDGLLRNEVASHIFFDRRDAVWRGLTTGFSSFANPDEKKELFAVTSKKDPRFGFSVMHAAPFGAVGDIEDPHILYDSSAAKWRILTCVNENKEGYRAVMLESDNWNKGYQRIARADKHNATGTSIQRIGDKRYCFSGSSEREIFIYTYPDLDEAGTLKMDLPPWDAKSGTRVWPNVVELPEGYPFRYIALMMDRFNYPGIEGPHWSYGALYLFHGYAQ